MDETVALAIEEAVEAEWGPQTLQQAGGAAITADEVKLLRLAKALCEGCFEVKPGQVFVLQEAKHILSALHAQYRKVKDDEASRARMARRNDGVRA